MGILDNIKKQAEETARMAQDLATKAKEQASKAAEDVKSIAADSKSIAADKNVEKEEKKELVAAPFDAEIKTLEDKLKQMNEVTQTLQENNKNLITHIQAIIAATKVVQAKVEKANKATKVEVPVAEVKQEDDSAKPTTPSP